MVCNLERRFCPKGFPSKPAMGSRIAGACSALLLLLAARAGWAEGALLLAEGGQARTVITLPQNASGAERFVAEDLALHLKKITGAGFRIVGENAASGNPAIFVGATRAGEGLRREYADRPGQTLLIRCDERGLVLTGTDEAGTRHAVYEWLYRLGCRWYTPYDWGEIIPRAETLAQEPLVLAYASPFVFRHSRAKNRPEPIDAWRRRNHSGGDESGWMWHGGGHSWVKTLIPAKHFAEHPDWFALLDGKRDPGNLCATNPDVAERIGEVVLQWQRGKKLRLVCVSPSDHAGLCECADCRKLKHSEQILRLANSAARHMSGEFPDAYVTFYANYHSFDDPSQLYPGFKPEPNVMPWVVYRFPDWSRPINSRANKRMREALRYWGRCGNPLGIYTYGDAYSKGYAPVVHCLAEDIPYLRKQGVIFVYDGSAHYYPRWALQGLNHYVQNRLLWRPDTDVDALLAEYYRLFFGPASGTMRAFYELLETTMAASKEFREDLHPTWAVYHHTFPPAVIGRAGALLEKASAEVKAAEPVYGRRLSVLLRAHEFVRLDTEARSLVLEYGRRRERPLLERAAGNLEVMIAMVRDPANRDLFSSESAVGAMKRRLGIIRRATDRAGTTIGPGRYSYKDYLDGGGRIPLDARSWDGFHFGHWGIELAPGTKGTLIHSFSTTPGCRFESAVVNLHFRFRAQDAQGETLEVSIDGGKSWQTVFEKGGRVMRMEKVDLAPHTTGATEFLLRFTARNETRTQVPALDFLRVTVTVKEGGD